MEPLQRSTKLEPGACFIPNLATPENNGYAAHYCRDVSIRLSVSRSEYLSLES